MGDVMDQENSENTIGTYDHFFSAEACLPDEQGGEWWPRVTKRAKDSEGNPIGIEHPTFFAYYSLYEVYFTTD